MTTTAELLGGAKITYDREGWCEYPLPFDAATVALLKQSVERISREARPEVVHEKGSGAVRAVHGCHTFDSVCARFTRLPRLVDLAQTLVGAPVYVYQFKVNLKQPYEGAAWPWHQDFTFWTVEDGMPAPDAVNITICLDNAHAENGPLVVIPGSHRHGLIDAPTGGATGDWRSHVSTDLAYTVSDDQAGRLLREYGSRTLLGPAGTVYAFHPSIVHSSSNNRSPDRRALMLITYNAVHNAPPHPTRPEFLVDRNTAAIERADSDSLTLPARETALR